ncbi:Uncharacterised protein [Mycobacteroides abscessus subsp. abscessus]|nr:Uncharacterised protein [Mycobacteroides abscessus subsp. bolletii]SLJ21008.1 Uncharacterised protein [Mycobacteroides abscessus subsp. abscessus]SLD36326.1 Uncharacterised protein [Mycobacteroides abscessus subsp. bolletii]SLJ23713.1 Uncharacterised protein [Mycobacteroides abscessus subsp. abscessus]SLJ50433.1 Uncharacterised protein [Mycobacteroides abscessus subsp. abscessus]
MDDLVVYPRAAVCGECGKDYIDNTGGSICIPCLAEALGWALPTTE